LKAGYDYLIDEIKEEHRQPTREELQIIGRMVIRQKWQDFKERLKFWKKKNE
jgi:hypothetical protein